MFNEANAIWYLTVEVPETELLGYSVTDESVFKVDLNFIKGQLFRMIYPKYNRTSIPTHFMQAIFSSIHNMSVCGQGNQFGLIPE